MAHLFAEDLEHVLKHTIPLWEELRQQRLFITGGTGFLGAWLLESFNFANVMLNLQAEAVVLTRNAAQFYQKCPHLCDNPAIRFHDGNIIDFKFPSGGFSHIIHAAAEVNGLDNDSSPLLAFDMLNEGTRRVLDFAVQCKAKRFLLTSSGAVYDRQAPGVGHLQEDAPPQSFLSNKKSAYSVGKYIAEYLSEVYAERHGLDIKIARCFAFVGPHLPLDRHFAIGNFIRDGLSGGPIVVKGDGTPYRSYLYAADLAIWLWTILFRGQRMRPYNVGSDEALTINEVAHLVAKAFNFPLKVNIMQPVVAHQLPDRYLPDIKRAREELDLKSWINTAEAINKTIQWNLTASEIRHSE